MTTFDPTNTNPRQNPNQQGQRGSTPSKNQPYNTNVTSGKKGKKGDKKGQGDCGSC